MTAEITAETYFIPPLQYTDIACTQQLRNSISNVRKSFYKPHSEILPA